MSGVVVVDNEVVRVVEGGIQGPAGASGVPAGGSAMQFVSADGLGGSFWRSITADLDKPPGSVPISSARITNVGTLDDLAYLYDEDTDSYILDSDHVYLFLNHINIGTATLQVPLNCFLVGIGSPQIIGAGPIIEIVTGGTGNVVLDGISLIGSDTNLIVGGDTSDYQFYANFCAFIGGNVNIENWDVASLKNCFFQNARVHVQGTLNKLFTSECVFYDIGSGNAAVDIFPYADIEAVDITSCFFKSTTGIAVRVDPIATVGEGIMNGNLVVSGATALSGITDANPQWFFSANSGVEDTTVVGESHSSAPWTADVITQGVPVQVRADSEVGDSTKRFVNIGDTELQYTNNRPATVLATATLAIDPAGNNQTVRAYFTLNGNVIVPSSSKVFVGTGSDIRNITLVDVIQLQPNDILGLAVANESSTADIVVDDVDFIVKG